MEFASATESIKADYAMKASRSRVLEAVDDIQAGTEQLHGMLSKLFERLSIVSRPIPEGAMAGLVSPEDSASELTYRLRSISRSTAEAIDRITTAIDALDV